MLIPKVENRIRQYLVFIERQKYQVVSSLSLQTQWTKEINRTPPTSGEWQSIRLPYQWGEEWTYYWFRTEVAVPDDAVGLPLYLRLTPNADTLVFLDDKPIGAVNPQHDVIRITDSAKKGRTHHVHFEAYAGHRYPGSHPLMPTSVILTLGAHIDDYPNTFRTAELVVRNEACYGLFYDALVLFELSQQLEANSLRKNKILRGLYEALAAIPLDTSRPIDEKKAAEARGKLAPLLAAKNGDTSPEALLVGHAHIDHAWLWPISETEHKAARTFANMAGYAEEYPEFVFIQSQPAQLDIVRREYPAIFESVVAAYKRGQWEPNGGMWIEADCNITGGESLVRQFLVGKKASREMLGYEGNTLWLPDVFGYAAALPQILAGCEVDYFVTSKINWNDTTRFPYDTFIWRGIDGTGVRTHFITSRVDGYNGKVHPRSLADSWNQVQHKEIQEAVIVPIGEGDGGGGTRRSDLENARRLANLEGAPRSSWKKIAESLEQIFQDSDSLPHWQGELYLELHRGTYTTQAKTKRYNRKLEFGLRECEALYSLDSLFPEESGSSKLTFPAEEMLDCWKTVLTNQFHDIIPGSSINRVYKDAEAAYARVEEQLRILNDRARTALGSRLRGRNGAGYAVFNSMSWERDSLVALPWTDRLTKPGRLTSSTGSSPVQASEGLDGEPFACARAKVPAMGAASFAFEAGQEESAPFSYEDGKVETPFYHLRLDPAGRISSVVDKEDGREFVREGDALNRLQSASDVPVLWDAWDIDSDWKNSIDEEDRLESTTVVSSGPLFLQIRQERPIGKESHLRQDIYFYAHQRRIDFVTRIDWRETHRLLKVAFPTNVATKQVKCEVQYGHVVRNTHTNLPADRAQFEICSHKWMAVEEPGHGAALLNDSKYGCDVEGASMRLTLLRSPKAPDPEADMGVHYLTYSLLPFRGDFVEAGVVPTAYELNQPMSAMELSSGGSEGPESISGLSLDNPNVVVEALKPVEGDEGSRSVIVRLYESVGSAQAARLTTTSDIKEANLTNMLERQPEPIAHSGRTIDLHFRAFEIKTLKIQLA